MQPEASHSAGQALVRLLADGERPHEGEGQPGDHAEGAQLPGSLDQLLHPTLDPKAERRILASGLPAADPDDEAHADRRDELAGGAGQERKPLLSPSE